MTQQGPAGRDEMAQFVAVALADTEKTWHGAFRQSGRSYREPKLVLFTGAVQSACGFAQAAMGPFYCPQDHRVCINLSFYEDLKTRFNAPAISRRPTSSPTRWGTTSRTCSGSPTRSRGRCGA
ncbi:MAG: putative neutral zinc metallopeptidase [Syntrophaceae bacterium PtaB.Bin038]|nr:MAG: putative neutral zinc metallopeptidase [Syntrophaceae bacterium PtaB.Bin038]